MSSSRTEQAYEAFLHETGDKQIAATLCVALALEHLADNVAGLKPDNLEHALACGVRAALFGVNAKGTETVLDAGNDLADALRERSAS